ncbi:hypothetical protein AVEN_68827-1 [Araneus ventricosus]|uniref:Uncharacterized protein n=1 Tax=Araneus ventricosus TaxID=182803 RepID=A0A4Y2C525_ARAVE|nr:hypothetical protein AVEN_68827-1 [Araneus ventricosus]
MRRLFWMYFSQGQKGSVIERQFLLDQRGPRIGRIGPVDKPVTKGMIKRVERSCKKLRPEISLSESSYLNAVSHSLSNTSQHFGDGDDVARVENKAENNFVKDDKFTKSRGKIYKPKLDLTETVIIAQRYNVSERAVAYITSSVLHAALKAVIISSGQSSDITSALIVEKNKIRYERLKVARNLKQRSTDDDPIKSLYFDGRKDETKTQTGIFTEEHISLVAEPNSNTLVTSLRLLRLHMMRRQLFLSTSRANSKVNSMKLMCLDVTGQTPIMVVRVVFFEN